MQQGFADDSPRNVDPLCDSILQDALARSQVAGEYSLEYLAVHLVGKTRATGLDGLDEVSGGSSTADTAVPPLCSHAWIGLR